MSAGRDPSRTPPSPAPSAHGAAPKVSVNAPRPASGDPLDLASVVESGLESFDEDLDAPAAAPAPAAAEPQWRDAEFGPYRLLERVAVGGMAEVFRAKRRGVSGFEKVVAVKRILPHLSDNEGFVEMFVHEAKVVAGLTHPNIVPIFDLGRIGTSYYIAMEFVNGRDLRAIVARAREKGLRVPLDLGLRVAREVCSALEYAHRQQDEHGRAMEIVHRDVSPPNILISFEGEVKLVDFGIAKAVTKAQRPEDSGILRGKLLYMSPEQAWGGPIDGRSDVFSLGVVLYELVTGVRAFAGGGSEQRTVELVRQCLVTPPREVNPRVPEALDRVVMKALAREPDERFADAGQMLRALDRILGDRPPVTARDLSRFMELLFDRTPAEPDPSVGTPGESR